MGSVESFWSVESVESVGSGGLEVCEVKFEADDDETKQAMSLGRAHYITFSQHY